METLVSLVSLIKLTEEAVGVNGHLTRLELEVRPWAGDIACSREVGPTSKVRPVIVHRNATIPIDVVIVGCCLIEHNQAGELVGILTLSSPGLLNENIDIIVKSSCEYQATI